MLHCDKPCWKQAGLCFTVDSFRLFVRLVVMLLCDKLVEGELMTAKPTSPLQNCNVRCKSELQNRNVVSLAPPHR